MADNINVTQGSGKTIAADEISSVLHQRVKVQYGVDGSATDVSSSSPLPVSGTVDLGATDNAVLDDIVANQTDNSQKTQIVDASGNAVSVTGNKLDVNATASLSGEAIPVSGATTGVAVAVVDGSGNQVTSFGGGTQYTEADTDASITGTAMMMEGAGNALVAVQGTASDGVLVNLGTNNDITGTVTANAGTNLNTSALALESGGNLASIKAKTDNIPALGQALASASVPVILPAATITTLTPPAAITGFATSAKQDTIIGHVDGIETSLSSIDGKITAVNTGAVVVSSSALPTGASTSAKQPALGTAGTASADVITVQGITSMTALKVDGSAVTQPISGTVTANLSATDNAVLDDIALDTEAIKTSLAGTLTVTGGGGGVEYTEGDTDATITGSAIMFESNTGTSTLSAVSNTTPLPVSDAGGTLTVDGTVAVTNAGITTIAGAVSGTEMQVDVLTMPTTTVTATDLDIRPLLNTDVVTAELSAVDNAVLDSIDTKLGTIDDSNGVPSGTALNSSTAPVTVIGMRNTAGNAFYAAGVSDNAENLAVNGNGNDLRTAALGFIFDGTAWDRVPGNSTDGLLVNLGTNNDVSLNAGTNAIGKLAANSGVDIGDVDVTSISAGTNLIGDVGIQPRTTNGLDTFMASGSDGSSILVATAQAVKASAGKVYGYYLYNPESAVTFVHFYNTASGSVTVGTTSPLFTLQIPPASAANLMSEIGITFGTAITIAATTTAGGNTAPATGVSATIWFK